MNLRTYLKGLSLFWAVGFLVACGDVQDDSSGGQVAPVAGESSPLLVYVPDDTPYVMANSERLPDHLLDLMWKLGEPGLVLIQEAINKGIAGAEGIADPSPSEALLGAVLQEFDGKMNRQALAELGVDPRGNLALYGIGVLPVLRAEITDSAALDATIKRIEKAAGANFIRHQLGEVEYFEVGDDEMALIISIDANQLLLALTPTAVKAALLPRVLGIEKPANNIADSGRLDALNSEFGLTPYSTLLIDLPRLVDSVLNDQSESAVFLFADQRANLSQACRSEYLDIAAAAPRLVSGYTDISATRIEQFTLLELRSDIAEGLNSITVSMPGLGLEEQDALFYFALGLDIIKTKQFLQGRIDALNQSPYQCEHMASANAELALAEQRLNQPLPPFVGNLRGVRLRLSSLDLEGMAPKASGLLMVAMDNPQLVLGMGQAFVPQLAQLQVSLDGQPVALPADLIPIDVEAPHLAMTDAGIAVSVGAGKEAQLAAFLDADGPDGPVFLSFGYSGEALALYQSQVLSLVADADEDLSGSIEASSMYVDSLEQVMSTVSFTQQGVEVNSVYLLKQ